VSARLGPAGRPVAALPPRPWRADDLHLTLAALVLVLLWDLSGLDRAALHLVGDARGFPWRDHVLTSRVLHDGGRWLAWCVVALLVVNLRWPLWIGPTARERRRWLTVTLLCVVAVPALKQFSGTSCPWDQAEFGGVAGTVSHWALGVTDGGPGRVFPSGHATAAFAFFGGWFVLRDHRPRVARAWLGSVAIAGVLFGGAQWLRGAHPPSHTLWTAWLCWALSATLLGRWRQRRDGD